MNGKTPVSFLLSVLAWMAFGLLPAHAAAGEGKFHLVYLVSTDKVEVGAKAYVEPLFFTDGHRLVFAYDYCRQYYNRTNKPEKPDFKYKDDEILLPEKIGDHLSPIHRYCDGRDDVTIDFKNYVVRNNAGERLGLSAAEFTKHRLGPIFPNPGTANIVSVGGQTPLAPEFKHKGVPQYFFLMSSNPALLDRIAPARVIRESDKARLDQRWEQYRKDRFSGRRTTPAATGCAKYWATSNSESIDRERLIRDGNTPVTTEPRILSLIYDDIDKDGKPDLLAYVLETIKKSGMSTPTTDQVVILVFYGNDKEQCILRNHGDSVYRHTADGPAYLVHVGACRYLGLSLRTQSKSVDLFSLPVESPNCKNRSVNKYETR